jgi:hypothetical protein
LNERAQADSLIYVANDLKCPGGEIVHPVLSPNPADVQCRIEGGLRPAQRSPCCNDYTRCSIWRYHVEIDRGPSTKRQRDAQFAGLRPHVLS